MMQTNLFSNKLIISDLNKKIINKEIMNKKKVIVELK